MSAEIARVPVKFSATFAPRVIFKVPVPREEAELHCKMPAEIELAPVKVLAPERTSVLLSVLLKPPLPLIVPLKIRVSGPVIVEIVLRVTGALKLLPHPL